MYFCGEKLFLVAEQGSSQSMGFVLVSKAGQLIAIDGGTNNEATAMLDYIKANGSHVAAWFVTHAHSDHLGAITEILKRNEIKIDKLYFDFPEIEWLDKCEPHDTPYTLEFLKQVKKSGIAVEKPAEGDEYIFDSVAVKVLQGMSVNYDSKVINNTSIVLGVKTSKSSVLFLADIEIEAGSRLIKNNSDMHYDIVQMAHHGQHGVAFDVYKTVSPTTCIWNTPIWLWNNDSGNGYNSGKWGTLETRKWVEELGVTDNIVSKDGCKEIL